MKSSFFPIVTVGGQTFLDCCCDPCRLSFATFFISWFTVIGWSLRQVRRTPRKATWHSTWNKVTVALLYAHILQKPKNLTFYYAWTSQWYRKLPALSLAKNSCCPLNVMRLKMKFTYLKITKIPKCFARLSIYLWTTCRLEIVPTNRLCPLFP